MILAIQLHCYSCPLFARVAGKEAMIEGPGSFNKAASLSYKSLDYSERAELKM